MHHRKTPQTSTRPLFACLLLAGLLLAPLPAAALSADAASAGPAGPGAAVVDLVWTRALAVWDDLVDLVVPSPQDDDTGGGTQGLRFFEASDDGTNEQGSGLDPLGAK